MSALYEFGFESLDLAYTPQAGRQRTPTARKSQLRSRSFRLHRGAELVRPPDKSSPGCMECTAWVVREEVRVVAKVGEVEAERMAVLLVGYWVGAQVGVTEAQLVAVAATVEVLLVEAQAVMTVAMVVMVEAVLAAAWVAKTAMVVGTLAEEKVGAEERVESVAVMEATVEVVEVVAMDIPGTCSSRPNLS